MNQKSAKAGAEHLKELLNQCEANPKGYCHLVAGSGYYSSHVLDAVKEIKLRASLGVTNKADQLLMVILAESMYCSS